MSGAGGREGDRLEALWAGEFGARYAARNPVVGGERAAFWDGLLERHGIRSVLEVGCGQGANLAPITRRLDPAQVWGIDVAAAALERAREHAPGANVVRGAARRLPFRDRFVDLVFTVGVLIHQPEETLGEVIDEIVRCADRFVLWAEYNADRTEEVAYRDVPGSLFRRDYGAVYAGRHPQLVAVDGGLLDRETGFDRVTWQLLERR
jgi:pseudaminic acid biosynthesis-associated methylase